MVQVQFEVRCLLFVFRAFSVFSVNSLVKLAPKNPEYTENTEEDGKERAIFQTKPLLRIAAELKTRSQNGPTNNTLRIRV